jgi:hypothetical protein
MQQRLDGEDVVTHGFIHTLVLGVALLDEDAIEGVFPLDDCLVFCGLN